MHIVARRRWTGAGWRGGCFRRLAALSAVAQAATIEDFRRLLPGFGRAYRAARRHVWKNKRGTRGSLEITRDWDAVRAVVDLCDAAKENPILRDPEAADVRDKLAKLRALMDYSWKPGTEPEIRFVARPKAQLDEKSST